MKLLILISAFVAFWSWFAFSTYGFLGFGLKLHYNDQYCTLIGQDVAKGGLAGSEDLAHVGDGIFFVSSGDLQNVFYGEPIKPGAIYLVDVKSEPYGFEKLPLLGFPDSFRFSPHGIYFSNTSQRLYVVSHGFAYGGWSRVVIFKVEKEGRKVRSLTYVRSITSPTFPNGGLNDVIEGVGDEIYVTQWLQYGFPAFGLKHAQNFLEGFSILFQTIGSFISPTAPVYRCTFSGDDSNPAQCKVVISDLYSPNGITKTSDSSQIFVNDALHRTIAVYKRSRNGDLNFESSFLVKYTADNIEWVDGKIMMGTVPIFYKPVQKMMAHGNSHHQVAVPGGLSIAQWNPAEGRYEDSTKLNHDGTKLSQISVAYAWNDKILLGSPFSNGLLVCKNQ